MRSDADIQNDTLLREFLDQPEEIRRIFVYAICQTMVQTGALLFMGAFNTPGLGVTLIYKNPDTSDVFEILKPHITEEEEHALREHIGELLRENALSA